MQTVKTQRLDADAGGIARAAALLQAGRLVAFGTETVYGLGADAAQQDAIAALYAAKARPRFNPLIAHVADADAAFREVQETPLARILADAFWPGPLTLVLPRRADSVVCPGASAGLPTLAIRVPAGETTQQLLHLVARPIVAPSANPSGGVSPTEAAHVLDGLYGRIDAVLDCGPCAIGVESTVLDLSSGNAVLLRPGGVASDAIQALLALHGLPALMLPGTSTAANPVSPGMLASHYAPVLPVRLDAESVCADEALLAFGTPLHGAGLTWNLSPDGHIDQAAARLFAGLRTLDVQGAQSGLLRIAVMPIPAHGVGAAIRDRLHRAAAPRALSAKPVISGLPSATVVLPASGRPEPHHA